MASIAVLDKGYVSAVEHWGSDERIIEAARMSTDKGCQGWDTDAKLLARLWKHKHATPFEMAGLIVEVKAPIFVFREWHRHRTQSFNEMSARYVPLPDENYVPSSANVAERSQAAATTRNRQASGTSAAVLAISDAGRDTALLIKHYADAQNLYEYLLKRGWPKELARLCVPVARYSRMRASANLRNWLAFLTLRMAPEAQWEIRQYANAVGKIIAERFPRTWSLFAEDL